MKRFSTRSLFKRTSGGAAVEAGTTLEALASQGDVALATATMLLEANACA